MENILKLIELYGKGKFFMYVKILLDIVFSLSITYAIFKWRYPFAKIPSYNSLEELSAFVINGYFIVPLSIFVLFFALTYVLAAVCFQIPNDLLVECWRSKLLLGNFNDYNDSVEDIGKSQIFKSQGKPLPFWFLNMYKHIIGHEGKVNVRKFVERNDFLKENSVSLFAFILRSIIAMCIYRQNVEYLSNKLFVILLLANLIIIGLLIIVYQFSVGLSVTAIKCQMDGYELWPKPAKSQSVFVPDKILPIAP